METAHPDHSQMTRTHPSRLRALYHITRPPGWMPQGHCPENSQPQEKSPRRSVQRWATAQRTCWPGGQSPKCPVATQPVCLASGLYLGVLPARLPQWSSVMLATAQAGSRVSRTAARHVGKVASREVSRRGLVWALQGSCPDARFSLLPSSSARPSLSCIISPQWSQAGMTQHRNGF